MYPLRSCWLGDDEDAEAGLVESANDDRQSIFAGAVLALLAALAPASVRRRASTPKPSTRSIVATSVGLKIVFAQDVHGPLLPSLLSNADDYQASLQRLIDLDANVLYEGHYGIYKGRQDIVRFVRSFMR